MAETTEQAKPEVVKLDPQTVINDVISKIENNNFQTYIYCPAMSIPSGGIAVLFKYAQILQGNGYGVTMIYEPREDQKASYAESTKYKKRLSVFEVFNPTWAGDITNIKFQCLGDGEMKFTDGSTKKCAPLTVNPEDVLIIPEGFPNIMEKTAGLPCKRIVLAQSWYYILNAMQIGQRWQHFGIKDVISVSDGITQYLNAIMPGLTIKNYSQSIDRSIFKKYDITAKNPVVAFMAGRTSDAVLKTYNVIKTFYLFYPQYKWIRFDELKGLSKEDYAERLGNAAIALYTDEIAGFGTFPLEAMAVGTHVVGWTPVGGKEYMNANNGFWAMNGDVFQLAELLGHAIEKWLTGKLDAPEVDAAYEATLTKYTAEQETQTILNIYTQYKQERAAELRSIKQF